MRTSFVLVQANWSVERILGELRERRGTHLIVHRRDDDEHTYFYLYEIPEVVGRLSQMPLAQDFRNAYDLHEYGATSAFDVDSSPENLPPRYVAVKGDRVVGFEDEGFSPGQRRRDLVMANGGGGGGDGGEGEPALFAEPAAGEALVQRSLVGEMPKEAEMESTVAVLVSLKAAPGAGAAAAALDPLPEGTKIVVYVQPQRGYIVEGKPDATLVVSQATEPGHLFQLTAVDAGPGKVSVFAFRDGEELAEVKLESVIVAKGAAADKAIRKGDTALSAQSGSPQPDLSLWIFEREVGGKKFLDLCLNSTDPELELNMTPFTPIPIEIDPVDYFTDFFKDIEDLPLDTAAHRQVADLKLAAKGSHLFTTVFPRDLQEALWRMRDKIQSIQIQSEEPWIPWELCRLQGKENGRVVEGKFLGEAYAVTRWLRGTPRQYELKLNKIALVVPSDSHLPEAPAERAFILSLKNSTRDVVQVPATYEQVQTELAKGLYDGWHFSGHGGSKLANPDSSVILLENKTTMTPEAISGDAANFGLATPIVFFNACEVGQGAFSLTGVGGWAKQFVTNGAGAFVGTYWSVYDESALKFAKEFYNRLISGTTIGEAAKEARLAIRGSGDPTWMAYTIFAEPLATLVT